MFFYSEPLIFIIQVLCFYKFANSFYKVAESQMALKTLTKQLFKKQKYSKFKIQNRQRGK